MIRVDLLQSLGFGNANGSVKFRRASPWGNAKSTVPPIALVIVNGARDVKPYHVACAIPRRLALAGGFYIRTDPCARSDPCALREIFAFSQ